MGPCVFDKAKGFSQSFMNHRLWNQEKLKKLSGSFSFARGVGLYHPCTMVMALWAVDFWVGLLCISELSLGPTEGRVLEAGKGISVGLAYRIVGSPLFLGPSWPQPLPSRQEREGLEGTLHPQEQTWAGPPRIRSHLHALQLVERCMSEACSSGFW